MQCELCTRPFGSLSPGTLSGPSRDPRDPHFMLQALLCAYVLACVSITLPLSPVRMCHMRLREGKAACLHAVITRPMSRLRASLVGGNNNCVAELVPE